MSGERRYHLIRGNVELIGRGFNPRGGGRPA